MQGDRICPYTYTMQTDMKEINNQRFFGPVGMPLRELHVGIGRRTSTSITLIGSDAQQAACVVFKELPILKSEFRSNGQLSILHTSWANLSVCLKLGIAGHCGSPRQQDKAATQQQGDLVVLKLTTAEKWWAGIVLTPARFNPFTPLKPEMHDVIGIRPRKVFV